MKCPSCGVWNRAHFNKCFRCGADLHPTAADVQETQPEMIEEEFYDAPVQEVQETVVQEETDLEFFSLYDNGDWEDEDEEDEFIYGQPPVKAAPADPEPVAQPEPEPIPEPVAEIEPEQEIVSPVLPQPAPVVIEEQLMMHFPDEDEDEQIVMQYPDEDEELDDEPATVYQAPVREAAPEVIPVQEETRKFAPVIPKDITDGSTRKFTPVTEAEQPVAAQPAADIPEPEVAPVQPGISHEIIHAIFTNPPSGMQSDAMPEFIDEPRPRKLMSRTRRPAAPLDEEPATVYKKHVSDKPEPRVDNVEEFKPTARMAAKMADERGDEYTAFATAERKLVPEVLNTDPFDAAFDLPKPEQPEPVVEEPEKVTAAEQIEVSVQETIEEEISAAEMPAENAEIQPEPEAVPEEPVPVIVEAAAEPEPEQPDWVKEALFNLGQTDVNTLSRTTTSRPRTARTLQDVQIDLSKPRTEEAVTMRSDGIPTERPRKAAAYEVDARPLVRTVPRRTASAPAAPAAPVVRPEVQSQRPVSRPQPRQQAPQGDVFTAPARNPRTQQPVAQQPAPAPRRPVSRDPEMPPMPQRPVRRPTEQNLEMPARPQARPRPAAQPAPAPRAERPVPVQNAEKKPAAKGLKLPHIIIIAVAALIILGLLLWGGIALIKGAVGLVKNYIGQETTQQDTQQDAEVDPNAPTVSTGTVNGRPGHIITFKGNDNDIIYISNENLENSYNIPIVGGIGTLEIEDSVLIGNRYVTDDVEVTLNPVLHEAGSGKETPMNPVTFTVTPPDAFLEIVNPEGGVAETTLGTYQVKVRVQMGSQVTIAGNVVSDMIAEEENGIGAIVYNVSVEPTGDNSIPVIVQKEGCKSITKNIVLTRPVMSVPIELDAATPNTASGDSISISGKVEAGVKVKVSSPISGDVNMNSDGSFSFTAKLEKFGENDITIIAEKGEENSVLVHTVTYTPTYNDYVAKAWRMDYEALDNYAGDYQPFKCVGKVVEVYAQEPYTCVFNVGSDSNPKHIYLEMVPGKPLSTDKEYIVYADTHEDGTKEQIPYMIGRFFIEAD